MEQRVSLITLGVADLRRAREFYEQFGWRGQEVEAEDGSITLPDFGAS